MLTRTLLSPQLRPGSRGSFMRHDFDQRRLPGHHTRLGPRCKAGRKSPSGQ